ncbi:unnamed protein product, partial [Brassica oleracea]
AAVLSGRQKIFDHGARGRGCASAGDEGRRKASEEGEHGDASQDMELKKKSGEGAKEDRGFSGADSFACPVVSQCDACLVRVHMWHFNVLNLSLA